VPAAQKPTSRNVEGLGLPKVAIVMPYAPFYVGVVASIIELILVRERGSGARARCSGTGAAYGNHTIVMLLGLSADNGSSVEDHFSNLRLLFFLSSRWSAYGKGATHRIAPLAELAAWLNKHIDPRR